MAIRSSDELLDWLQLYRSQNIGPISFKNLLMRYGSARAAIHTLPKLAHFAGFKKAPQLAKREQVEQELEKLEKMGGKIITIDDLYFPELLKQTEDCPPLLSVLGRIDILKQPSIAMVGARNASINGRRFAQKLGHDFVSLGFNVVSGLARGIDGASHKGALSAKGQTGTIAVVAGGVDFIYPAEHLELYKKIKKEGVILSEMMLGQKATAHHFPRRNRIISGLSYATVVVEASLRSGSLITARYANEQNREVFAVPAFPQDTTARGCNALLRQGAILLEDAHDVVENLRPQLQNKLQDINKKPYQKEKTSQTSMLEFETSGQENF
ncbi:MAG: DNA-processing protein DprA, partial [Pseudomonadota bacterium]